MKNFWIKTWEREYNPHRMAAAMESLFSDYASRTVGVKLRGVMSLRLPNGNDAFFFNESDWQKFQKYVQGLLASKPRFTKIMQLYKATRKSFLRVSKRCGQRAFLVKDNHQLEKIFTEFRGADSKFMLIGQCTMFYLVEAANEAVAKIALPEDLNIILSPERMSQIRKERLDLLQIVFERNPKKREKLLKRHISLFQWIPCINVFDPPSWDRRFFMKELRKLSRTEAKNELVKLQNFYRNIKKGFRKLLVNYRGHNKFLIQSAHLLSYIKDDRDDARRLAYFYSRPMYQAVAARLRIVPENLMLYTSDELLHTLKTGRTIILAELNKRKRGYGLMVRKGGIKVVTSDEYHEILKSVSSPKPVMSKLISGIIASKGKAKGAVKICPNIYSLGKIKRGNILVTVITHPDYLPAMRIAKAIVTDEGSLTSHAAIVSRELGIPCIVGTKIATKVLKDGDMVEVDANKGVVRKLN